MRRMISDPSAISGTNVLGLPAWARAALAAAIVAASLWDFRLHDLRVFDLAAFVFLLAFFVLDLDAGRDWLSKRVYILPLVALVIVYAALGYLNFHHRSSLAIVFLAILCLQFAGYGNVFWISRVFRWVIYLNVAVLVLQFVAYHLFGVLLDPQRLFGWHSRVFYGPELRPAGLFQEPNSYSLNMFVIASLALLPKRDRGLALVAAASVLMTQSLWGSVAAFVLMALNEWNANIPFAKKVATTLVLWAVMFAGFNGYLWLAKSSKTDMPRLYARVLKIGGDPSARDRYGAIIEQTPASHVARHVASRAAVASQAISSKGVAKWEAVSSTGIGKWLGHGLSTSVFIDTISANGLSFLWYCFEPVGLVLLITAFGWALTGLSWRDKLYIVGAMAFAFTSYPLVTYAIFWIWLPGLLMLARQHSEESRIVMS